MNQDDIQEIIDCLPSGRTLFPYFRDRYAALLLAWIFTEEVSVAEVKRSRYASLITKNAVRDTLARCGKGTINSDLLSMIWSEPHEQFLLTLDSWGGYARCWQQTSRAGHNIVLQVNLHDGYQRLFNHFVPEDQQWLFNNSGHPVLQQRQNGFHRPTLGWVRMDMDLNSGEALLEEVQTDWLRDLNTLQGWNKDNEGVQFYCNTMLKRLGKIWSEVLMSAALWFLRDELGIRQVWLHTWESGCELKRIQGVRPPKSLYTKLPRQFCFEHTQQPPEFLLRDKSYRRTVRGKPAPHWFHLQL